MRTLRADDRTCPPGFRTGGRTGRAAWRGTVGSVAGMLASHPGRSRVARRGHHKLRRRSRVCASGLRGSRRRHDDLRWRPIGRATDDSGRWNQPPGTRAGVQRQSEKRMVTDREAALYERRSHVQQPARTNGFGDHPHDRRTNLDRYPSGWHRSGPAGTRPTL